ncbi:hypothetical protein RchiOBHm_Chr5g0020691 [Rosa chinensis]|uniref:Uncharacterized protein n=1 Tax=Rosa chinensis TaxID=74649 RepID=A0A2P6Q7D1_ROSCH|nr:hypothetical protein RchiOBHm_Chr5g0020691 [Rosa chinensis]
MKHAHVWEFRLSDNEGIHDGIIHHNATTLAKYLYQRYSYKLYIYILYLYTVLSARVIKVQWGFLTARRSSKSCCILGEVCHSTLCSRGRIFS